MLASAGIDGTVRLWDPKTGKSRGEPLLGHTGGVRGITFGQVDGQTMLASAGADGTVRIWDPRTRTQQLGPIEGHTGSALGVAMTVVGDQPMLASAGDDGTVRLWDPRTGSPLMEPLKGHAGGVRAVRFGEVDRRTVLASASDDGTARLWDPSTGAPLLDRLTGHTGLVRSVSFVTVNDRVFLASAGIDGTVRLWDPRTGIPHPEPIVSPVGDLRSVAFAGDGDSALIAIGGGAGGAVARLSDVLDVRWMQTREADRSAIVSADIVDAVDAFGRVILARHLHGVIGQLTATQMPGESPTVVISIDGRWGSGKTTLARLLVKEMTGERADGGAPRLPYNPLVVGFDAWRESAIAPHWWSIAAALNRGIRRERGLIARISMTLTGSVRRIVQSPVSLAAVALTILVVLGFMAIRGAAPNQLNQTLTIIQVFITAATAIFATAALAVRSLFWSSPALGRLHVRADDNPLGEVARMVSTLRRWSPRERTDPLVETAVVVALIVVATYAGRLIHDRHQLMIPTGRRLPAIVDHPLALCVGGVVALLVVAAGHLSRTALVPAIAPYDAAPATRAERFSMWLRAHRVWRWAAALAVGVLAGAVVSAPRPSSPGQVRLTLLLLIVVAVALVLLYWRYVRSPHRGPRRPVVLVLDELDRCSASTVVAYLETVHTLLRKGDTRDRSETAGWRSPAPLIVLVLADGRWVRTAFTSAYEAYKDLGSPVRTLGGDFLQKLFDHTVLVPELTAEHVERMLTRVALRVEPPPPPAESPEAPQPDGVAKSIGAPDVPDRQTTAEASAEHELLAEEQRAADEALAAASPQTAELREAHLLSSYTAILPSNPRLIRRVANAWGMLDALKSHLGHGQSDDTIIRAAVLYVAFPSLVDTLLDDPIAPNLPDRIEERPPEPNLWLRPDVLAVLTRANGTLVPPESIARCYGKTYPST
jgi:ABC-type multidrug transport system fused ATPase/permease subunit